MEGYKREKGEESEWTAAAERCLKRDSTGNSHPFDDGALPRARDDQVTHTHTSTDRQLMGAKGGATTIFSPPFAPPFKLSSLAPPVVCLQPIALAAAKEERKMSQFYGQVGFFPTARTVRVYLGDRPTEGPTCLLFLLPLSFPHLFPSSLPRPGILPCNLGKRRPIRLAPPSTTWGMD